jgi:hypothetical protein
VKTIRLTIAALGAAAMGYALWAAVHSPDIHASNGTFLLTVLVLHDGLLLPVFLAAGVLVHRLVPARVRAIVQAALIASASVTLVAVPFVLGYGRIADNPSALPLNYTRGLLLTFAAIWATALAVIAFRYRPPRHAAAGPHRAPDGEEPSLVDAEHSGD